MKMSEREAQKLHYEVMGIALAIRGHEGESTLYHEIDQAISDTDFRKMSIIQYAFEMLPSSRQSHVLTENFTDENVVSSIAEFNAHLRAMLPLKVKARG